MKAMIVASCPSDYSGALLTYSWRPILSWTIEDVIAIHKEYDVPMNKLYAMGARRVGCWPCVMSVKAEIRNIALNFPERIEEIRKLEADIENVPNGVGKTFFAYDKVPERFRTKPYTTKEGKKIKVACIDDVVRWSMTGKRAKGHYLDEPQEPIGCSSGFCE